MNKNKIDKLVAMLEKYPEIYILSDEIYSKIIFNDDSNAFIIKL